MKPTIVAAASTDRSEEFIPTLINPCFSSFLFPRQQHSSENLDTRTGLNVFFTVIHKHMPMLLECWYKLRGKEVPN